MSLKDYEDLHITDNSVRCGLVDALSMPESAIVTWRDIAKKAHDSAVNRGRSGKFFAKIHDYFDMLSRLRRDSCGYITIADQDDLYTFHVSRIWEQTLEELTEETNLLSELANNAGESDPQRSVKRSLFHLYRVVGGLMHFAIISKEKVD